MTNRCIKCGRKLTREPVRGMGPTCAKNAFGTKPRRVKAEVRRDELTADLFAEVAT